MRAQLPSTLAAFFITSGLVGACTGQLTDVGHSGTPGSTVSSSPNAPSDAPDGTVELPSDSSHPDEACFLAPQSTRRLTNLEYQNTINDLFGIELVVGDSLIADRHAGAFSNDVDRQNEPPILIEQYLALSLDVIEQLDLSNVLGCSPNAADSSCVDAMVEQLGSRVYRRPPTDDEKGSLLDLFASVLADPDMGGDPAFATRVVLQAMLNAPQFLYLLEGVEAGSESFSPVDHYAMASRISYLVTGTMPDQSLLNDAAAGRLQDEATIRAHVERLMATAQGREHLADFFVQWLNLEYVFQSDQKIHSLAYSELPADMMTDSTSFIDHVLWDEDGRIETLFSDPTVFATEGLAAIYGLEHPGGDLRKLIAPNEQRPGIFTRGAFLAAYAHSDQSDPIRRGQVIRQKVLCGVVPEVPADIEPVVPDVAAGTTTRERLEQHTSDTQCSGCHQLFDPIGFGLEGYDHVGQWRETEAGKPVDTRGEIIDGADASGTFNGAVELGQLLSGSTKVQECAAEHWFRFAMGRDVTSADSCSMRALSNALAQSDGSLIEMITTVITTDAFLYRTNH